MHNCVIIIKDEISSVIQIEKLRGIYLITDIVLNVVGYVGWLILIEYICQHDWVIS